MYFDTRESKIHHLTIARSIALRVPSRIGRDAAFVLLYLLLDWASYQQPMFGINITPWNPEAALAIVYWYRFGRSALLPYFAALLTADAAIRHLPVYTPSILVANAIFVVGYGAIGEILRRSDDGEPPFVGMRFMSRWLAVVIAGAGVTSALYTSAMTAAPHIPGSAWLEAAFNQWVGQSVGIVVNMPFLWMVSDEYGRERLRVVWRSPETIAYAALAVVTFAAGLEFGLMVRLHLFYLLMLPVIWAGARQGMAGAAFATFSLQAGLVIAFARFAHTPGNVYELQILVGLFALVGFLIGLVVDRQWQTMRKLKQTLHVAAAGELTAALAHELIQPLTALASYGAACKELADRGETGLRLQNAIESMIRESNRATDVVRRLREFFRTGAAHPEQVDLVALAAGTVSTFDRRARDEYVRLRFVPCDPVAVVADPMHIAMAVRNLIANAFEAVAQCPESVRSVTVTVHRNRASRGVCLTVEDSGLGVSAGEAGRIFDSFYTTKASGLGLGLVVSRALVEAHGGRLWAEVAGHGIFNLELPIESEGEHA